MHSLREGIHTDAQKENGRLLLCQVRRKTSGKLISCCFSAGRNHSIRRHIPSRIKGRGSNRLRNHTVAWQQRLSRTSQVDHAIARQERLE